MKFLFKDKEYYIDGYLASMLNSIVYNIKNDWDFVILITGDRGVRVGKSVLGMTVCAYLASKIIVTKTKDKILNKDPYNLANVFFDNQEMVTQAQIRARYSIIHYDEGREGLAANKAMRQFQQDLLDFFAECGQLNHIFVIVCPDFFELKENMAVARSECLINVYRKEVRVMRKGEPIVRLDRGFFECFNKNRKRVLYDMAKSMHRKVYSLQKPNFKGRFTNQFTLGREEYEKKKLDSLKRFAERHKTDIADPGLKVRDDMIMSYHEEGLKAVDIQRKLEKRLQMEVQRHRINQIIRERQQKEAKLLENEVSERQTNEYTNKLVKKQEILIETE